MHDTVAFLWPDSLASSHVMASHRSVGWFFQPSLRSNDIVDECIDIYHNRFAYNLRNTNQMFVVILLKGYIYNINFVVFTEQIL